MLRVVLLAATAALFAGLAFKGADGRTLGALFSGVMLGLACLAGVAAPAARTGRTLARHAPTALACAGFLIWASALAFAPAPEAFAHPIWGEAGLSSGFASMAPHRTIEGIAAFLSAPGAFLVGVLCVRRRDEKDVLGFFLVTCGGVFSLAALIGHLQERAEGFDRLAFTLGSPNAAALAFALIALGALCLSWRVLNRRIEAPHPLFALACAASGLATLALALAALLLTASRAGLAVGVFGVFVLLMLLLYARPRTGKSAWRVLAPLVLIAGLVAAGAGFALERMARLDPDAQLRGELVSIHWRFFEQRPWTGHGLNTFHELHQSALTPDNYRAMQPMGSAHNIYVQALEETGIIGAGLLGLLIVSTALRLIVLLARRESGADWAGLALASLMVALLHGTVDFGLQLPALSAWIALLLGAFSTPSRTHS